MKDKNSYFYDKPEFSTILGLIKMASENKMYKYSNELRKGNLLSAFDKLENWIEESYAKRLKHYVTFCEWSNFSFKKYVTIMIPKKKTLDNPFIEIKLPRFLNAKRQITIKDTIFFSGIGLHTGKKLK